MSNSTMLCAEKMRDVLEAIAESDTIPNFDFKRCPVREEGSELPELDHNEAEYLFLIVNKYHGRLFSFVTPDGREFVRRVHCSEHGCEIADGNMLIDPDRETIHEIVPSKRVPGHFEMIRIY